MVLLDDYSLLWPDGRSSASGRADRLPYQAYVDLGMDKVAELLGADPNRTSLAEEIVRGMVTDAETIEYRLDVLDDFLNCPVLYDDLAEAFQSIEQLRVYRSKLSPHGDEIRETLWQFRCLELFIESIEGLHSVLDKHRQRLRSPGLLGLLHLLEERVKSDRFGEMKAELVLVRDQISNVSSVVIRIDLNDHLVPARAQLLSVDSGRSSSGSLITRLLGRDRGGVGDVSDTYRVSNGAAKGNGSTIGVNAFLLKDLEHIFRGALDAARVAVSRYISVNTHSLRELYPEIQYYVNAAKLIRGLQNAGLTMVRPQALPMEQRRCMLREMRDMALALDLRKRSKEACLDERIVPNDVDFGEEGRLFILTGPNQGGKTTYTRAIGACQVLFQAGLYLPCLEATMSPADHVFTHFPEDDRPDSNDGRLSSECRRLREVFETATRHSLLLLNESLASTSPSESLYLAKGIVKAISLLGARAVFATHLHDLAYQVEAINEELQGDSRLVSMVAGTLGEGDIGSEAVRTYKIMPAPPIGNSYAEDIARRHGISFSQLCELLKREGASYSPQKDTEVNDLPAVQLNDLRAHDVDTGAGTHQD